MMKRKLLAVVLPIVGCATVVGSGFAAWYFGDDMQTTGPKTSATVNVNVTEEVMSAKGLLNLNKTADNVNGQVLVLDQGGINSNETQGIMIGTANDKETVAKPNIDYSFTLTWGPTGDEDPVDLFKIYEAGMEVRLTVTITLGDPLSNYIELVPGYSLNCPGSKTKAFGDPVGNVYTAVWAADKPSTTTNSASWEFNLGFDTNADLQNEAFKYRTSDGEVGKPGKPNASGEPLDMKNKVQSSKIDIAVKAELADTKPVINNEN